MKPRSLYLLDFRHKKRRPWTSFFDHLVGRGNLNWSRKLLILKELILFFLGLECFLEYANNLYPQTVDSPTIILRRTDLLSNASAKEEMR